jgi:hypothetical protein
MDWATIGLSVILGAVVQTSVIVVLYNRYIIPHIIAGVKDELMISIKGWVDGMTSELSEKIAAEIDEKMLSLKRSFAGKRGNDMRLLSAAQSYLFNNLDNDAGEDDPNNQDVIAAAVAKYTQPIVDTILSRIWPKKEVSTAAQPDPSAAGWC